MELNPYGTFVPFSAYEDDPAIFDGTIGKTLEFQMAGMIDNPMNRYINSSWMNALIWEYQMATARVVYKTE